LHNNVLTSARPICPRYGVSEIDLEQRSPHAFGALRAKTASSLFVCSPRIISSTIINRAQHRRSPLTL